MWQAEASACHTDSTEKPQAPDDGCINVRNMLSIDEVKYNIITSAIKLISYSSTINNDARCNIHNILTIVRLVATLFFTVLYQVLYMF